MRPTKRDLTLWEREWVRPQAVMWERNGQEHEVALYVRNLVKVEKADAPVSLGALVKQQQEALGLSLPGLQRLRWRIEGEPVAQAPTARTDDPARQSAKARLQALRGGRTA